MRLENRARSSQTTGAQIVLMKGNIHHGVGIEIQLVGLRPPLSSCTLSPNASYCDPNADGTRTFSCFCSVGTARCHAVNLPRAFDLGPSELFGTREEILLRRKPSSGEEPRHGSIHNKHTMCALIPQRTLVPEGLYSGPLFASIDYPPMVRRRPATVFS